MRGTISRTPARSALVGALVGGGVVVAAVAAIVMARDGDNSAKLALQPAAQVSSLQQGCGQWLAQDAAGSETPGWCAGLSEWMTHHMGATGMSPQMMWGSPEQMRASCRQWISTDAAAAGPLDGQDRCDAMVEWMNGHMQTWTGRQTWGDWMMHGPMMGR
jgi:hypothetical protein